ncbi:MAG: pseudouridine synthase [Cyclobacteriaceae bacterium]|jgi:23S rRNA pseudouridine2605 synthase|nr:pseudouridine synthase [Cyclobacteriaceae bacterium]
MPRPTNPGRQGRSRPNSSKPRFRSEGGDKRGSDKKETRGADNSRGDRKNVGKPRFGEDKKQRAGSPRFESRGSSKPYGEKRSRTGADRDDNRVPGERKFTKPYPRKREADDSRPRSFGNKPRFGDDRKKPFEKREERSFDKRPASNDFPRKRQEGDESESRSGGPPREGKSMRSRHKFGKGDGERPSFVQSRINKKRVQPDYEEKKHSDDDLIRLNRFISNSGVCSRREADNLISMGLVSVNGKVITELGFKVKRSDDVRYEGRRLKAEKPVYILLNKPKGYITTTDDPEERRTVMHLIADACQERVYPVGRLDRNTTGLLLLTNDGDLADKLTHPSYNAKKIYKVELDKPITKADFEKVAAGVHLEEGRAMVDDLAIVSDDKKTVGIELHIGWNRIVRRIFESLDYQVVKLDRVVYAGLDKKDIGRGEWRFLKPAEVSMLKSSQLPARR